MKKILLPLALASALTAGSALAAAPVVTGPFNVNATVVPVCTATTPSDVDFTYTSFQATPVSSTGGGFTVKCTSGVTYSLSLSAGGAGTVAGLNYTLAVPSGSRTGTGADESLGVTGSMVANQAGACPGNVCTGTTTHTLTVTY